MSLPTLHVLGLPHTQTTNDSQVCAFTQKAVKFTKMMRDQGYKVNLYWGEENTAEVDEHIVCVTKKQQKKWYGSFDPNILPTIERFEVTDPQWVAMNKRMIKELKTRVEPQDIICVTMGRCHKPVVDAFPAITSAEHAIGYSGAFSNFCCFESYAWMHYLYGDQFKLGTGRFYDTVIPNFFFTDQFPLATPSKREDYLLFVGRLIENKGLRIASEIAQRSGRKLIVAGPGAQSYEPGRLVGVNTEITGDHFEYIGILDPVTRGEVMSRAAAIMVPTTYIEPFGAVAVEAMLSGTPAITTDWGAFTETVEHGVTGFRFRTLAEGVEAVDNLGTLDRKKIRKMTQDTYSIAACGPRYDRWFKGLDSLWGEGFYS